MIVYVLSFRITFFKKNLIFKRLLSNSVFSLVCPFFSLFYMYILSCLVFVLVFNADLHYVLTGHRSEFN